MILKKSKYKHNKIYQNIYSFLLKLKKLPAFNFFLGIITSFLIFILVTRHIPSSFLDSRTINEVTSGLNKKYIVKVLTTEIKPDNNPSIIVWGNDKNINKACYSKDGEQIIKNKPILYIYKKNDLSILSIIPYFKQEYKRYYSFDFSVLDSNYFDKSFSNFERNPAADYWIADVKSEDLNGDGTDEIIIKAYSYMCGSGGIQYQFILNDTGTGFKITSTFPPLGFNYMNKEVKITDKIAINYINNKEEIYYTSLDSYIDFEDLDKDGTKELILGYPVYINETWSQGNDCHKCGHTWLIGVYKFNGKEFIIDNNWNYGLFYKTPNKITLGDALGYPHFDSNIFNLIGIYYFDCDVCNTFYNGSRIKSELLKIVEDKYAKFPPEDTLSN